MTRAPVASGAVIGATVPHSYGSVPGELAACIRNVGLVERADLAALPVSGDSSTVELLTGRLVGFPLAVGGSAHVAGVWWCRPAPGSLLLIAAPAALHRAAGVLRTYARRSPTPVLGPPLAVLGIAGRATVPLLRALGVYGPNGDPREAAPCAPVRLAGTGTVWLLESDVDASCCVPEDALPAVKRAIASAGYPLGLARVGLDALAQYRLLVRAS
jgi:hypothetical protein